MSTSVMADTQVYRCERDGETIFSQIPCAQDAQKVEVKSSQADIVNTPEYQQKAKQKLDAATASVNLQMKKQGLVKTIQARYAKVEALKKQLALEFEALRQTRFRTAADAEKARATLEEKFKLLIEAEHQQIVELDQQLKSL